MSYEELAVFVLFTAFAIFIIRKVNASKKQSTSQRMLLGIGVMIFSGVLLLDQASYMSGLEYIGLMMGLFIMVSGYQDQE